VAPVFPVSDLAAALAYYRGLGFGARQWHGGGYGFVAFDGAEIHLGVEEIRDNLVARIAEAEREGWTGEAEAADTGAQLLWRVKADLTLPALALLPDGSYSSVLVNPKIRGKAREALLEAAGGGEDLDEGQARYVRVVEYEVPDRDGDGQGEVIALVTTITAMTAAAAPLLARHTTEGGSMNLKPERRHRTYPRVIKRASHNSYRVKRPGDHGTRLSGPATIKLVNLHLPALAA
jgi:hypothetical protein